MFNQDDDRFKPGPSGGQVSVLGGASPKLGKTCSLEVVSECPDPSRLAGSQPPVASGVGLGSLRADPLWVELEAKNLRLEAQNIRIGQLEKKVSDIDAENSALIRVIAKLRNELDRRTA